jgi:hypothetical protein
MCDVETVNIKIIDAGLAVDVVERRALAQRRAEKPTSVG